MTQVVPQIDQDIPCITCGYNLRGLPIDHQCPECGHSTRASYLQHLAHRWRFAPLEEADPRWLSGLMEGAVLVVIAGIVSVIMVFYAKPNLSAGDEAALLALIAIRHALEGVGVWKLAAKSYDDDPRGGQMLCWFIRTGAVVTLAWPALAAVHLPSTVIVLPGILAMLTFLLGPAAFYLRLRYIARRAASRILVALATVLMAVTTLYAMQAMLPSLGRASFVYQFLSVPSLPYGSHQAITHSVRLLMYGNGDFLPLPGLLAMVVTLALFIRTLRQACRSAA